MAWVLAIEHHVTNFFLELNLNTPIRIVLSCHFDMKASLKMIFSSFLDLKLK
jgi:hypothetical protein